ncbi:MAG: hypothetical protein J5547_04855 [Clostridia bacterium]|nr:hypothetical protein [Clostridia bacterium]
MKRLIALILSVLMISLVFAACSKTDPGQNESKPASSGESADNSGAAEDSSAEEESEDPFEDGLPEKNYGGREFRILQRTEFKYEFENDETVPEKVNQLVAERNRKVEDRFGVKIVTVDQMGAWGKHEDFMSFIRNSMVQEDPGYDIIAGYAAIMPSAIGDDLFRNWHDLDDWINFDKSWWSQDIVDELTVNGRLYLLTGDISMTFWDMMTGMFFNKELASLYSLDLYSLVRSHDWTFDKMLQICKDTYIPTDDDDARIYSYCTQRTTQIDVYQDAFGINVTEKDGEGRPHYTVNNEKTYNALHMLFDLVVRQPFTYIIPADESQYEEFFGLGRSLFEPLALGDGIKLKNYDIDYGILPMPLYNKEQDDYYTTCRDNYSVFAVPATTTDDALEFVGIITEALCVESSRTVIPQYYNIVLKERNTTDADSVEMIDIVRKGVRCNFGYLYSYALDWPAHQLNICINNEIENFDTNWQSKQNMFESNLEDALAYYFD